MYSELLSIHKRVIKTVPKTVRSIYNQINWNSNAICITGARGVGKTTLLLQHCLKKYNGDPQKCLYFSADHILISAKGLYNVVSDYFNYGGSAVIIDEVHKSPNWSVEIKSIIDSFPEHQVFLSGSSAENLLKDKGDLSRRVVYYKLAGLSFREYLNIKLDKTIPSISFSELLHSHERLASKLDCPSILKHFRDYLEQGYYPYCFSEPQTYNQRMFNVIEKVLYEDIAEIYNLRKANVIILKKILWILASSAPFQVNIEKLSQELHTTKITLYNFLEYLERSALISSLAISGKGTRVMRKPAKLFLENTNLIACINGVLKFSDTAGAERETFFINQVKQVGSIDSAEKGDFLVNKKFLFEVGGKNKKYSQIKDIASSFLAIDGIEIGEKNKIPLWLFGFLY